MDAPSHTRQRMGNNSVSGAGMQRWSLALVLHLVASSVAAPVLCEDQVVHLEAKIHHLTSVIYEQHRYIQQLHSSQAKHLHLIPNSPLGPQNQYKDCSQVFAGGNMASGLYVIRPDGSPTVLTVYCDMNDGGGWTVFQRRKDGKESFDRTWVEYKHGFGDLISPDGEFWMGNDPLHLLTSQGMYDLRISMEDFEGNQRYAEYKNFKVDGEKDHYQMHVGEYRGNAGDALADTHNLPSAGAAFASRGVQFSTRDHPSNDEKTDAKCVRHSSSGWWFSRCNSGNLNGHYYNGPYQAMTDDGVVWYTWHGWWYSIKSVVMMVRAADLRQIPSVITSHQLDPRTAAGKGEELRDRPHGSTSWRQQNQHHLTH